MKKSLQIIIPILICFTVGFISSQFQSDSIKNWYPTLTKPSLTPPNIVFPIVWSILYFMMGLSIGLIISSKKSFNKNYFIRLFIVQLILNFTWSILFFYMQKPSYALLNILLLYIAVIYYTIKSYTEVKESSFLFIPYLLWISFASYLNFYIFINN